MPQSSPVTGFIAMEGKFSRRKFLKQATLAVGAPMIVPASVLGRGGGVAPSSRVVVAGVGLGPRGREVLGCFLRQPDVHFVAIADPQKDRRETIKKIVERTYKNQDCATTWDMFEVFERDDVDAILITTGDRWHGLGSTGPLRRRRRRRRLGRGRRLRQDRGQRQEAAGRDQGGGTGGHRSDLSCA